MFNLFKKDPDSLLKQASAKKDAGELDQAIELLRKAYKIIEKSSIEYSVKTFLRLPLYLQKAGRNDEAWKEFNLLLLKGFPNQNKSSEMQFMDQSIIYDKMRLFLQRERKNKQAFEYGIFSYLSYAIGLYNQKRKAELRKWTSKMKIKETVQKLLKRTNNEAALKEIIMLLEEELKGIPNIDFANIGRKIVSSLR